MSEKYLSENLKWKTFQDELADESGLAVIIVDKTSSVLTKSNNNSICEVLYNSKEYAPKCAEYCGKAFEKTNNTEKTLAYKCYAGLTCLAVPIKKDDEQFVAIIGRAFLKSTDYRRATELVLNGDWRQFSTTEFFENVLLSGSPKYLTYLYKRFTNLSDDEMKLIFRFLDKKKNAEWLDIEEENKETAEIYKAKQIKSDRNEKGLINSEANQISHLIEQFHQENLETTFTDDLNNERINNRNSEEVKELGEWRSLFGSLLDLNYRQACISILEFLAKRYSIESLAWAESVEDGFETILASGKLKNQQIQLSIGADDERLRLAAEKGISLELRERKDVEDTSDSQVIRIFPILVGNKIRSALVLSGEAKLTPILDHINRFCRTISKELEILRLREELYQHGWLENAVESFNENINKIDSEDFWQSLTQVTAELMNAERSSLLIFDEDSKNLPIKAATGIESNILKSEKWAIGNRIAKRVFASGEPLVVEDTRKSKLKLATTDRKYKTNSFISYPVTIGNRKIGVFNVTDKADGSNYNEFDLKLLRAIMPQFAVLIDRTTLKHQAGEFEQLSITDSLTGLLNRRYLEERITEEILRSTRHGYPMSFLMLDIDDFKSYNDKFTHPEGDKALKIVGHCIKDSLRGADVAARYGGEEFSILLPQTNSDEAYSIAERIREKIELSNFPYRTVTACVGVASISSFVTTAGEIIMAADTALFEAKRQGKNNVKVFEYLKKQKTFQSL